MSSSEPKATFEVPNMGVSAMAFSPRGNIFALAGMTLPSKESRGEHGIVTLWRAATDEEVQADIQER